jgi:hypothetical protein
VGKPHDRLTRICEAMTKTLESHPEHLREDKAIVFLDDGKRGGSVLHGYDEDMDAMVDLFMHLKAVFEANGKTLMVTSIGGDG